VTVKVDINKGWHIYANPVGNEDLVSAQTVLKINAKTPPKDVKVDFPPGKVKKDKLVGDYLVYEDQVAIKAKIRRAEGDTGPLEVSVRFMACHAKGICLQPATVKLTVP
jgi:thiol:disulfide interchange protein